MPLTRNLANASPLSSEWPFGNVVFRTHQVALLDQIKALKKERETFEQELLAQGMDPQECLVAFRDLSQDDKRDINIELRLEVLTSALPTAPSRLRRPQSFL
jgi:hypothetical protein